jgi:hypothetical protein
MLHATWDRCRKVRSGDMFRVLCTLLDEMKEYRAKTTMIARSAIMWVCPSQRLRPNMDPACEADSCDELLGGNGLLPDGGGGSGA